MKNTELLEELRKAVKEGKIKVNTNRHGYIQLINTETGEKLKELFSEVIGHIAKKPEMNGNLEHMIRASAMVIQMIDDASTVNALNCSEIPNNWIPCSERLPEEETDVLVTRTFLGCKDGSHGWNNHIPPTTYVEVAQYFNGEWTALSDEYKIARNRHTNPIAWMPLPEPYQERGEQE